MQPSLIRFCLWQKGEHGAETPSSHATHAFAKGAKTVVIAGRNGDVKFKGARDRKREVRNIACSMQSVSVAEAHSKLGVGTCCIARQEEGHVMEWRCGQIASGAKHCVVLLPGRNGGM